MTRRPSVDELRHAREWRDDLEMMTFEIQYQSDDADLMVQYVPPWARHTTFVLMCASVYVAAGVPAASCARPLCGDWCVGWRARGPWSEEPCEGWKGS